MKAVVWAACLAPLAWLYLRIYHQTGGYVANPASEILHTVGKTGLNLLLITLAVTPIRTLTGFNLLQRFRRLLALDDVAHHPRTFRELHERDGVRAAERRVRALVDHVAVERRAAACREHADVTRRALRTERARRKIHGAAAVAALQQELLTPRPFPEMPRLRRRLRQRSFP